MQRGGLTWGLYPLVVVRVDAHLILFEVEGILTGLNGTQLVVAVEVRPPPQATVNDVRKPLTLGDLQATVQGSDWTVNRRRIERSGVRSEKGWLAVRHSGTLGQISQIKAVCDTIQLLRIVTWFGQGSCIGLTYPTALSYLVNSGPIFQSNCCAEENNKSRKRIDKHGAWLIWKYQCGYC